MATPSENNKAMQAIMPRFLLDEFIDWISVNMAVEDVFQEESLDEWAKENGYIKQEDF